MNASWLLVWAYVTSPLTWIFFVTGAVVGSFLNVCIFRIPEGTFWSHARSVCRGCGRVIPWYRNIPILTWLGQRGRAHCCGAKLSPQYVLVELGTGLLFAAIYWKAPFLTWTGTVWGWEPANAIRAAYMAVFCSLMIVCAVIDIRHMIIPDVISLPMIALTPLMVWIHPDLDWLSALLGVLLGFGLLYGIAWLYWLVRKEVGMGMGDVKLLAAIGGWLGVQAVLPTVLLGSVSGALVGLGTMALSRQMTLKSALPFGPFLAAGASIHLFLGGKIQELFFLP